MQIVEFLIPLLDDKFPLIRSISCWTLSRFSKYIVQVWLSFCSISCFSAASVFASVWCTVVACLIHTHTHTEADFLFLVSCWYCLSEFHSVSGICSWPLSTYILFNLRKVATKKDFNNLTRSLWVFYGEYWILTSGSKRLLVQLLQH